jgi:trans-AT polyketide synthase/acyltransferase/oxidoreductase domain-containing protein
MIRTQNGRNSVRKEAMTEHRTLLEALRSVRRPLRLVRRAEAIVPAEDRDTEGVLFVPALPPERLGDPTFLADHQIRSPYAAGAMANGIASVALVTALSRAGLLGFFGAAGLSLDSVRAALDQLRQNLGTLPYGCNFIHSPQDPELEMGLADLLIAQGINLVEASAYLDLTPAIVSYRLHGIHADAAGRIVTPNRVVAKVSRVEVATKFLSPAPDKLVGELVRQGQLTPEQARLAARVPMCQDLTGEADSGGHTDNRPLITLLPTLIALRDRLQSRYAYPQVPRIGAAGGIATPAAVAGAFALGAAYVVTGSINQACLESGSSNAVRALLAQAEQADTAMAPAADMFEMGVKVQVLKRGTMFAMRAARLYELYRTCASLDDLPAPERAHLEKTVFRASLDDIWHQTRTFFLRRDPSQVQRAEADPRHRLALVFRWYLGLSSRWANAGEPTRQLDYQVWCGPSMGAFNEWARGSFLEDWRQRQVVPVGANLLHGAAVLTRMHILRLQGVHVPPAWSRIEPQPLEKLDLDDNERKTI